MSIEKSFSAEDLQGAQDIQVLIESEDNEPEIEIELLPDGGAEVSIGEEDAAEVPDDANLAEVMEEEDLVAIASELLDLLESDKESRSDWEKQYADGMEFLGFSNDERTKPFKGACGVYHPLLSESIVQFQATALKELMPSGGPVRTVVMGKETRERTMQAQRVKDFMNYQITTVMEEYTPEFDQLLFYVGYGGSAFKKIYYDYDKERMVSALVLPDNLYIPYYGSSVMSQCERVTHRIPMSTNSFRKAVVAGRYIDTDTNLDTTSTGDLPTSDIADATDRLVGRSPSGYEEEVFLLEFQVAYDLPGFEDLDKDGEPTGIKLPYIITIEESSGKVVGIRRNFDEKGKRKEYYVHYLLVQGPGAYGLGFLHLIGGLTKTATAALRQLIDAGTLANLPAGFKAKGARIMNDDVPLQPGEFRDMDAGGVELQNSLLPLPYKEPSQTLFQLLGFCVDAGRRLASITDMQVGDSNQNAAVGTTIALLEKGSAVMSAIHKRLHYAQSLEFKLLALGFGENLPPEYPYDVPGESRTIKARDFDDRVDVRPVSDPNIFSVAQRITMAQTELQLAQSAPQMHNLYEAFHRMYEAIGVRDIDSLLPPQNTDRPKDPMSENADVLDGATLKAFAGQHHDAHILSHTLLAMTGTAQANPLIMSSIQKHIFEHVRLKAEEAVEAELFTQYGTDPDRMVSALQREGMVAIKAAQFYQQAKAQQEELSGENQPPEDPVVELKNKELDLRAKDLALKEQDTQASQMLAQEKESNAVAEAQQRLILQRAALNAADERDYDRIQQQEADRAQRAQQEQARMQQQQQAQQMQQQGAQNAQQTQG
jgi:hypothetical protein